MDTKPIFSLLKELTRCDYNALSNEPLLQFSYNGITYAQSDESYQKKLSDMFNDFKCSIFDVSLDNSVAVSAVLNDYLKAQEDTIYDVPDEDYLQAMEREAEHNDNKSLHESISQVHFLIKMVSLQRWYLAEAIDFLKGLTGEQRSQSRRGVPKTSAPIQEHISPLAKKLESYGDFLSVKDMTTIFGCVPRTISNWEREGRIVNVASTSEELTASGRKKRGAEKRYRKDAILRSAYLQEKFNEANI